MTESLIVAEEVYKKYGNLQVLKGVSIKINQGEMVSIVGKSGAGKSTFLHILGTIDTPDKGSISIAKTDVLRLNRDTLATFRNKNIGFVFQFHHLLPEFSALENVCLPALIAGMSKADAFKKATYWLDYLDLGQRKEHKPTELSGGEQQRVAVARALINEPSVIFADEPTGNLDTHNSNEMKKLFRKLSDDFQQTFVIVTHSKDIADSSDKVFTMEDGKIVTSL